MARWRINRNLVPGHYRGEKEVPGKPRPNRLRFQRNPGYDIHDKFNYWGVKASVDKLALELARPVKPIKRREKRGQSKPR